MDAPCPSCGEETGGYGPRSLCRDCYLDEEEILEVPDEIAVERCGHCGRVRLGMEWVEAGDDRVMISEVLDYELDTDNVAAVSFHDSGNSPSSLDRANAPSSSREDGAYHLKLMAEKKIGGETFQQELETRIEVESTQCKTCSKFEGGYYEYKIQLRGEHLDDALEDMMERAAEVTARNRDDFVSDVEEETGGYDIYLSSRKIAEALLRVVREGYDMEEKRSKELIGEEEGQRVYRSVVSARVR